MKTVQANFTNDTTLLIQGVRGRVNQEGKILDSQAEIKLVNFIEQFNKWLLESSDY